MWTVAVDTPGVVVHGIVEESVKEVVVIDGVDSCGGGCRRQNVVVVTVALSLISEKSTVHELRISQETSIGWCNPIYVIPKGRVEGVI